MANWRGMSRSNYFRVANEAAFREAMTAYQVKIMEGKDGLLGVHAATEDGDWPSFLRVPSRLQPVVEKFIDAAEADDFTKPEGDALATMILSMAAEEQITLSELDIETLSEMFAADDTDWVDIHFPHIVAKFLADGEIGVFETVGHEKARYASAYAVALNNALDEVDLRLSDIYERAKEKFGITPTQATY